MKKKEEIERITTDLIEGIINDKGFELVDVDFVKEGSDHYLRVYIDKPGGITINDCEEVSREFNVILDEKNYIDEQYIFEVSSPGLTRPLKKTKDFERSIGKRVEFKLFEKEDGCDIFEAVLDSYTEKEITVETDDHIKKTFDKKKLAYIRLAYVEEEK